MNGCATVAGFDPAQTKETLNRWIAHETARATREVTDAIVSYRFNDAAGAIYRFVWNVYCDWYLELAKPVLTGADGPAQDRDAGRHRLGARRDPQAAASVHAVPHRGIVGGDGVSATACSRSPSGRLKAVPEMVPIVAPVPGDPLAVPMIAPLPAEEPPFSDPAARPRSAGWWISSRRSARCARR